MAISNPAVKAAGDVGVSATGDNIGKLSTQIFGIFDNVAKRVWEQQAAYNAARGKPIYVPPDVAAGAGVTALSTGLIIGGVFALGLAYILFKGGGRSITRYMRKSSRLRR